MSTYSTVNGVPEVVISGIGGCFPQSENIEMLKKNLMDQIDMIEDARWKEEDIEGPKMSGKIPSFKYFDANFFGIHARLADNMDPMARIALEKSFEAIIDAGVNPLELRGKNIGVYMGSTVGDNDVCILANVNNGFGIMGQSRGLVANRISYVLNFTGPSASLDNTWTGGLEAIKQGCDAIIAGQIDAALVGSVNLITNGQISDLFNKLGILSKDGKTKVFDNEADGYTRSDGICVFYLQRADLAKRHYASIVNCNVEFNGNMCESEGYCTVKTDHMSKVLTNFYEEANVDPKDVQYVETQGCGVKNLDEKELAAIDAVFNKDRDEPLLIGSVKSNLGHTEAASSMLSIAKVIIAMETGVIPGNLHYETPNKNIPALVNGKLEVVSENRVWSPSLAAVNVLGLANSFGHILLKANHRDKKTFEPLVMPMLDLLSTRTEEGIKEIIEDVKANPVIDPEYSRLLHDVFARATPAHLYRGYVIRGEETMEKHTYFAGIKPQIWFVYSGMGSQWLGMGKSLQKLPIFAQSIERSHNTLETKGLDLKRIITDADPNIFDNILNSFVGIAAIQIALTDVLHALGIVPDGLIGHSVGELGCAYADGCLTAEQMILSAYYRGRASLEAELIPGMMAAIGIGAKAMKAQCPPSIDIACHNGPDSCTLSGPKEDMIQIVDDLQSKQVFAKLVNVSNIAYHSRYIKPAAPQLLQYLQDLIPEGKARSPKWISTSVEESAWDTDLAKTVSAEYLTNNLLSSVRFEEGSKHIPKNSVVIEIAPHGLLQAILKKSLSSGCVNVPLTKRSVDDSLLFLSAALGELYIHGVDMNVSPLYPHVEYPVSRGTKSLTTIMRWFHGVQFRSELREYFHCHSDQNFVISLNCEEFRHVVGHRIGHDIVIPVTAYLPLIFTIFKNHKHLDKILFEDIIVKRHIVISETAIGQVINILLQRGTGAFEISDVEGLILNGRIILPESYEKEEIASAPIDTETLRYNFTESDLQNELSYRGCQFSGIYNTVKQLKMYNKGSTANIAWKHDWPGFVNAMFQVGMLCEDYGTGPIIPTFIRRLIINLNQLPKVQEDINVSFDYNTKIFTSAIVQIKDLKFSPYIQEDRPLTIETYNFIKFSEDTKDLQCEINKCLQVVQQNLESQNPIYSITEFKNSGIHSLENYIYNFSDHHFSSKIQLHILNDTTSNNIPISALTIIGEQQLKHLDLLFKQTTDFILVCLPIDQQLSLNTTIARIHSFHSGELQYHLLKQTCDQIPVIINIKSKCYNGFDLRNVSLPWVKQLYESLNACDENEKNIYLVSTILPENGIEIFLKDVKSLKHGSNIRLMFLLDEYLPELDAGSAEFYQEMFRKDLPVTVFKNGHWGSYFKTPYTKSITGTETKDNQTISVQEIRKLFHDYDVEYVGLNPAHVCTDAYPDSTELGPVNFVGCDKFGKRVMGIARANLADRQMSPDPELVWPMPKQWQTIYGATIPYAYACAYYVLFELAEMRNGDKILVHNGCSSFGQAVMQIAFNNNCHVITTVGSDVEKKSLLKSLNRLRPYQVLSYNDSSFQNQILQRTEGEGVNVIINCHTGKSMQSSLRYLGEADSRMVQLDLSDFDATNQTIGLQTFLSISGIFGFKPTTIIDLPHEMKLKIHAMVMEGLIKGHVQPLQMTRVTQTALDPVLRYLNCNRITGTLVLPINDLAPEIISQKYQSINFINKVCKKHVSYIVFGSDRDMLIATIRWLAMNGAELIGVFANTNMNFDFIKRRLASLRIQYNTDIKLIENGVNIPATLRDIHEMKKISAVLMLSKESLPETSKYLKQVDVQLMTLSSTAHLICFWGNQTSMTYRRSNSSLPVSNVKWDKTQEFSSVVPILEHILKEPADFVIRNNDFSTENNFSSKDFFALLSMSQDSIVSTVDSASTITELIQLPTKGARDTKEAYPAFIVPGLLGQKCKFFKTLLRKLLCPIYIVNNGSSDSLESVAAAAVEQIKEKSNGSFNIIGISFGGALALEIVKILEEQGERTQLYLIDGIPETIQNLMNDNGNIKWLETSLLSSLLRIDASESINSLRNAPNWDARVTNALKLGKFTKRDLQKVTKGLNIIKNKINQVLNYKPHDDKTISGTTRLLRPQDSSMDFSYTLGNCCKQVQGEIIKGNHFTFLETDKLAEYINDTVIIPPLYA